MWFEGGQPEEGEDPRDWFKSSSFVLKMMQRMGYQRGKGLGKDLQGLKELPGKPKREREWLKKDIYLA